MVKSESQTFDDSGAFLGSFGLMIESGFLHSGFLHSGFLWASV